MIFLLFLVRKAAVLPKRFREAECVGFVLKQYEVQVARFGQVAVTSAGAVAAFKFGFFIAGVEFNDDLGFADGAFEYTLPVGGA